MTILNGGSFVQWNDPVGNPLISINRNGTLSTEGINFPDGSKQITALGSVNAHIFNVLDYGADPTGAVDSTPAVNAAMVACAPVVGNTISGGGIIYFPRGRYLIEGVLLIPNDGDDSVQQFRNVSMRFTGDGPFKTGNAFPISPNSGSILDLRYNSSGHLAKIVTIGTGYFEMDHITLMDGGTDTLPFFLSVGTTCHIHDCGFWGTSEYNDCILLGGSYIGNPRTEETSAFSGYGTVIECNQADFIKRLVVLGAYANNTIIRNNTVWSRSANPSGGAIESYGNSGSPNTGLIIDGNLIEMPGYLYGIRCDLTGGSFFNNGFYDAGGTTNAIYRFTTGEFGNIIINSQAPDAFTFVSEDSSTAGLTQIITSHQSQMSVTPQPITFRSGIYFQSGSTSVSAPYWKNTTDASQFRMQATFGANPQLFFIETPTSGIDNDLIYFQNAGGVPVIGTGNSELKITAAGSIVLTPTASGTLWMYGIGGVAPSISSTGVLTVPVEIITPVLQITASSGAPSSASTAGNVGQIVSFNGVLYFCSVTGAAGSATWNALNMTQV
jgi:hypothetical protein